MGLANVKIKLIGTSAFFICGAPYIKMDINGIPVYLVDLLLSIALVITLANETKGKIKIRKKGVGILIIIIVAFILGSSLREVVKYKQFVYSFYNFLRYAIAMSIFFSVTYFGDSEKIYAAVLKGMVAGGAITSIGAILYAAPIGGSLYEKYILSVPQIFPQRGFLRVPNETIRIFERAKTTVGTSNVVACTLVITWPMALGVYKKVKFSRTWRTVAAIMLTLGPVSIFLTFSRAAYLSIILLVLYLVSWKYTKGILVLILMVVLIFLSIPKTPGKKSSFSRITRTVNILTENKNLGYSEKARVRSYTQPFVHVATNPSWLFIGAGGVGSKLKRRLGISRQKLILNLRQGQNHSVLAAYIYYWGTMAAIAILLVTVLTGRRAYMHTRRNMESRKQKDIIPTYVLPSFIAIIPFWLTDHFLADTASGSQLFFLLVSVISLQGSILRNKFTTTQINDL